MWLRLSVNSFITDRELVGFFKTEDEKTGALVVLRDGRSLASSFGLKVLTKRYKEEKSLLSFQVKRK